MRLTTKNLEKYAKQGRMLYFDPIRGYKKDEVTRTGRNEVSYGGNLYFRTFTHNNAEIWVKRISNQ